MQSSLWIVLCLLETEPPCHQSGDHIQYPVCNAHTRKDQVLVVDDGTSADRKEWSQIAGIGNLPQIDFFFKR